MAAPTTPTLTTLTTEGLKKAGYATPSAAQLTRAQTSYMEEIKNDIWLLGKRLKALQAEDIVVITPGQSRYNFPDDYSSMLSARLLYADDTETVADAAASTVTLSTDEALGEDELEGKDVLIYAGTGKGTMSQIVSYDEDTYIATVSPAWTSAIGAVAPVADDTYCIVDAYYPLEFKHVAEFDRIVYPHTIGTPNKLYQVGGESLYGYFYLTPTPDEDYYYAVHLKYYLNLLTLDLASSRITTLYWKWRNLWIQGVKAKQLENDDDGRSPVEMQRYFNMVRDTVALETYGRNIQPDYTAGIGA